MKNKTAAIFYNLNEETLIEIICALNNYQNSTFVLELKKETKLSSESLRVILYDWEMNLYYWIESNYITPSPFDFLRIIPTSNSLIIKINCYNNKPYKLTKTSEDYYSGVYVKDAATNEKRHANTKEILSMNRFKLWTKKSIENNSIKYTFFN